MIKRVEYNWFFDTVNGEQYYVYEVGRDDCIKIDTHFPAGEGDRFYCTATFKDGRTEMVFNVSKVVRLQEVNVYA